MLACIAVKSNMWIIQSILYCLIFTFFLVDNTMV
jgi:hypothetical protein